jgi:hypothetical protein
MDRGRRLVAGGFLIEVGAPLVDGGPCRQPGGLIELTA